MAKHLEVGIIGLGKFGLSMALALKDMGHSVVGIDTAESRMVLAQESIELVYKADASQTSVLSSLHFHEMDHVIISVGDRVEKSLTIVLNLQDLGMNHIWVKAANDEHRKILLRMGVERVVLPEEDAAFMAAHQLVQPGMLDIVPKYGGIAIQELRVEEWDEKTLIELDLIRKYTVIVLGVRRRHTEDIDFVPNAQTRLRKGDTLLVVGKLDTISKLHP